VIREAVKERRLVRRVDCLMSSPAGRGSSGIRDVVSASDNLQVESLGVGISAPGLGPRARNPKMAAAA